jgi:hypothetical protein
MPSSSGSSQLTEAGLKQIEESGEVVLDFSKGELLRSDVGLALEDPVPDVAFGKMLTLRLVGPKGAVTTRTDRVRFESVRGTKEIASVYYFLVADSAEGLFGQLRQGVKDFGLPGQRVEQYIADVELARDEEYQSPVGEGYRIGSEVGFEPEYGGPGHVNVTIVTVSPSETKPLYPN